MDGIEASAPETGSSRWSPNVDAIEEVEIIGIGVPAEFGNATGAVFNVVRARVQRDSQYASVSHFIRLAIERALKADP